jgi:hypothetical protein
LWAPLASADEECGTRLRPEDVELVRQRIADGVYDPPGERSGQYIVNITFHVVRRSDGTGGLDPARLVRALDDANLGFANSGIHFCWVGPTDYIDDDDFYYNIDTYAEIDDLRSINVATHSVNVYFTENLGSEDGPLCGISSFTFSDVQGIVMDNDCTAINGDHSTFAHELGHYFDLFHTHEACLDDNGIPHCQECADGSNCSSAGDLLCDTPADPGLGDGNVDRSCNYTGTERDPCNGAPYIPDPRNYMSYSRHACRNEFTDEQNSRALATLVNLRREHIASDCLGDNRWNLSSKLTASDGASADYFGASVSVYADTALIGAYGDDDNGVFSGSAYVFRELDGTWNEIAKLTASDGGYLGRFGIPVSLYGETALIAAPGDDDNGDESGSVYVFREVDGTWKEIAKVTASDGDSYDLFGYSVSLYGHTALIGARDDDDRRTDSGSAYVFADLDALRSWEHVGDVNCDGGVDSDDIDAFVLALISREDYYASYPDCSHANADIDCDESVDVNDIDPFVECITNAECAGCR